MKEKLPKIENYYNYIIEHTPVVMVVFTLENGKLNIQYVSENCVKACGYTQEEIYDTASINPIDYIHPDDVGLIKSNIITGGKDREFIYRTLNKDGTYRWVHIELTKQVENGKEVYYALLNDADDKQRAREAEKELSIDKEREKILLNSIPGGVALYHIMNDGTVPVSYISEGLVRLLGYSSKEFIEKYGNNTKECVVPEDRHIVADAIKNMLMTKEPISNHYRCYKKDGGIITISFDGNTVDLGEKREGEIATLYAVQTLVGDEHQKEMQEQEIRKRLIDNVPGGIGIYRLHKGVATLEYLNDAYLDMVSLKKADREKFYGHDVSQVIYKDDRHILKEMIDRIYKGERNSNVLFRVMSGNGKLKWINMIMRTVQEDSEHYSGYSSFHDFDDVIANQQEMELAHKREETLLSSIPGGIAIYHAKKNGVVTTEYVSEPLAKMCGYTAEEFLEYLKDNAMVNLVPEDIPIVYEGMEKALKEQKPVSIMYHIYKKDKTPILIRLDANIIGNDNLAEDEVAIFYGVHTLVSDEAIKMMEEQKTLNILLNSVPAGIGIYSFENGEMDQEYINDAFFEILNDTRENREQYAHKNIFHSIHKDDGEAVRKAVKSLYDGKTKAQVDFRMLNSQKEYMWVRVVASVTERREGYIKFFAVFLDYGESKEQELLLLQNQRAVELAQDQGDFAIWTYNIDKGTILQQVEHSGKGHMGYKVAIENVPQFFIDTNSVHPEDIDKFLNAYKEVADGNENVEVTYRLRDVVTGEFNWLHMFYQRMENSDKNERMAVGFSMNVDKQQEAIEKYQLEQTLREQMNENIVIYVEYNLTKDCYEGTGRVVEGYNKSDWEGGSPQEYMASLHNLVEEEYTQEVADKLYSENMLKAFEKGENIISVEYRGRIAENAPIQWYRAGASLVKRPDNGDVMAFVYVESIEKEKMQKLAIESSLSDGIENITIIDIADRNARVVRDDKAATEGLIGEGSFIYDDDFVWRSHALVVEDEKEFSYNAALLSTVIKELENQEIYQYSIGVNARDGQYKRTLFRFRYLDDRKTSVIMSVSDITAIYMEEQAKKKQIEAALAETKKASAAKAEFYSRMSHDMRTPMNGILGMTALSRDEMDVTVLKQNLEKIEDSGKYLLNLINDTLDIQRIESGKLKLEPQIIHTARVIASILELVKPMAEEKNIKIEFERGNADIDWYIRTDPVRMKQIFVNLLSNAIKFTPKGGQVTFASRLSKREGMISHDVITISDTGIGMSEDFLKNGIFQPFSQENNQVTANYAGSGLGLSIVKSLVELMGGHIEVESKLGVGTTFTVYLDFERVENSEAERIITEEKTTSQDVTEALKGRKILLVEDHPLNAEIAKKLLARVGCEVEWAENGKLGIEAFSASTENHFDAILMDIRMPIMDGLEAAKGIRALKRADATTVPIIAMTANAYAEDIKKSVEAGMNAHLGKPIEPQLLYETLAKTIGGGGNAKKL